jgi:hypothetical protein
MCGACAARYRGSAMLANAAVDRMLHTAYVTMNRDAYRELCHRPTRWPRRS